MATLDQLDGILSVDVLSNPILSRAMRNGSIPKSVSKGLARPEPQAPAMTPACRLLNGIDPWLLDDDSDHHTDSVRLLKTSMFPYASPLPNNKRIRLEGFRPDPGQKRAEGQSGIPSGVREPLLAPHESLIQPEFKPERTNDGAIGMDHMLSCAMVSTADGSGVNDVNRLSTMNMVLVQMRDLDWEHFRNVHQVEDVEEGHRIRDMFDEYLEQWNANRIGPFMIYARDRNIAQAQLHFAGLIKFSLSQTTNIDIDRPSLQIRFSLLPQYANQKRVTYESLQVTLMWIMEKRKLFCDYSDGDADESRLPCIYIPYEVSASRQNAIAMGTGDIDENPVLISSTLDLQVGAQQRMILVSRLDFQEVILRLEQQLMSPEMIQQVINADIWSTHSQNGLFDMVVKWEIPLIKIEDDGSIHLFMSTYHDTPVETIFKNKLDEDVTYRMRLDLCAVVNGSGPDLVIGTGSENCCRIRTKDVIRGQMSIPFSGVRKPKVGEKSKVYVIRTQLLRMDAKHQCDIVDTCFSSPCQLTSSRRVYRGAEETAAKAPSHQESSCVTAPRNLPTTASIPKTGMDWESRSPLLHQFEKGCRMCWKSGFPMWLFTQERVVIEISGMEFDEETAVKVQLIDVQSSLPVHLVSVCQGAKSSAPFLIGYCNEADSWSVDLRVNSKKEVQNRMSYLHVSFHAVDGDGVLHGEPIADFTSTFVINVGTTYANLRRRPFK
jgi:hypothetical protein